ncbi:MAG TPA: LPS assembly lipoprotein LptE [Alphaproteobacteria bacterium]
MPGLISACGFRPLYTTVGNANGTSVLDNVWIDTITSSNGVILRNYLLDSFYSDGYPEQARYMLKTSLKEYVRDVDVQKNDTTTRVQLVVLATYELRDRTTETVIERNQVRAVSGYNILLSNYTTLVSQNDARDRALRDIADKIQTRVALILSENTGGYIQSTATMGTTP